MPVSPVSTGGGGVVLEHRYGATLLSHLLVSDPVAALGDDATLLRVHFQTTDFSPVDDLAVVGCLPDGTERVLSIGVRRTPRFTPSSGPTATLIATYLRAVRDQWPEIESGRLRLGLAAASGVRQLAELAVAARASHSSAGFRGGIASPGRFSRSLRARLKSFDQLVGDHELSWRLLVALWPINLQLEATDQASRSAAVGRLRAVTRERTTGAASALFGRLCELAGGYASTGASVDQTVLRRDLAGWPLRQPDSTPKAWSLLDRLAVLLRDRTPAGLLMPDGELEIDRRAARSGVRDAMHTAVSDNRPVVITGEPDVGKSALTLRATEELPHGVVALSLRDLPSSTFEFEAELGADITSVLRELRTSAGCLLVVDGAEAVLEGRRSLLIDLLVSALRAGAGVATVTRTDGAAAVADCVLAAQRAIGSTTALHEHVVPGLDDTETTELSDTFADLHNLANDRRSAWLLRRPGLVDLVLRSRSLQVRPDEAMSEADVFALIWHGLVRRPEKASPDSREQTLLSLARFLMTEARSALDPTALASLRSDGLLLGISPLNAWSRGEEFASDLVRDLAVARLLLVDGWGVLADAEAPRWALRAAKLACQASLAGTDQAEVRATFDALASGHGRRWAEVPLEALLTASGAAEKIERSWPALSAVQRGILLRLGQDRYTSDGVGDPVVLAPLVDHLYCRDGDRGEAVRTTVLAWLRGVLAEEHVPLRAAVRDATLATSADVELIALLGADLDADAAAVLRQVTPARLTAVLGSPIAPGSMAANCPSLLFELCETFCAQPKGHGSRKPCPSRCEPFHALLVADEARALQLINVLLERDAVAQVDSSRYHRTALRDSVVLEFPDGSRRTCAGNALEWRWYRDVEADFRHERDHCALSAVEQHADRMVAAGVPVTDVVAALLRDCTNTPMAGLAFGLLVRYLETCPTALDTWLPQPDVWSMESSRTNIDLHLREYSADELSELWKNVGYLVVSAARRGDEERLKAFADMADELSLRAEGRTDDDLRACAWGAAALRVDNYALSWNRNKLVKAELRLPATALPELPEVDEDWELSRIRMSHFGFGVPLAKTDDLLAALNRLRHAEITSKVENATEATAVAVIAMQSEHLLSFNDNDLSWCATRLIDLTAARLRANATIERELHLFNWTALAALLGPLFDDVPFDRTELEYCLVASNAGQLVGVDMQHDALGQVWAWPCTGPRCRHKTAWAALTGAFAAEGWFSGHALVQCAEAAHRENCVAAVARATFEGVFERYNTDSRRSSRSYRPATSEEDLAVAGMFFAMVARAELEPFTRHLEVLREGPWALSDFLSNLAQHATRSAESRRALSHVWPTIMRVVLRDERDVPVSLLPVPNAGTKLDEIGDSIHFDAREQRTPTRAELLAQARADWLDPRPLHDLIQIWASRVRDAPRAVDALVGLARTTSADWQATVAMPLVEQVIGDEHAAVAKRSTLLPRWLADVHASDQLTPGGTKILHRMVDALVAEGDRRLVPLQMALE